MKRQLDPEDPPTTTSISIDVPPSGTFVPAPDEFLQTTTSSSSYPPEIASTQPPSSYLQFDPVSTSSASAPGAPAPSEFLQPTSLETKASSEYLQPTPGVILTPPSPPGAPRPTAFLNSVITSNGIQVTQTILPNAVFSSVTTIDGKPVTQVVQAFTTLVTTGGTPYIATIPVTAKPTGKSSIDDFINNVTGDEKDTYVDGEGMYFLGAYLPVIIATLFALPWTLIGETTKSLEPFYQMAKSRGSPAERSLAANFSDLLAPLWASFRTQWAVVISSILAWLAFLIVPLAPEAVSVRVIGDCNGGCNGKIGIFLPAARAIEGALAVMVIFEIILILYLWRKKTGVSADPRCIAGLATVFSDPDVQREFSEIYGAEDQSRLYHVLEGRSYKFEASTDVDGYTKKVAIIGAVSGSSYIPQSSEEKHEYTTVSAIDLDQRLNMRHAHRVSSVVFAILIAGLLAVILTYRYTGGDTGFEHFMSGQGFGVRFIFTLSAVIVGWFWARLFRGMFSSQFLHFFLLILVAAIALYAPYRRLFSGNATARESILVSPPLHPIQGVVSSVSSGHYLLALIAVVALLSEVLCVTLSAIPFNPATLYSAFNASTWISVASLSIMLGALVFIFFYQEPVMPIKPDTVAGNLVYVCDGTLPEVLKGLSGQTTTQREQSIQNLGLRYSMGYSQTWAASRLAILVMGVGTGRT